MLKNTHVEDRKFISYGKNGMSKTLRVVDHSVNIVLVEIWVGLHHKRFETCVPSGTKLFVSSFLEKIMQGKYLFDLIHFIKA